MTALDESSLYRELAEEFRLNPDRVVAGATLRDDLGLDSLAVLELLVFIEDRSGTRLPDDVVDALFTVADVHTIYRIECAKSEVDAA